MSHNKKLLQQITERLNKPSKPNVPRNQWQHPGEVTSIPSRFVTMRGVTYRVVGVGADGYTQLMEPGMDYAFPEAPVVEYPMMQVGGPAPLYVSDKNDPRLRAYNDSLELYKWNPKLYASGKKHLGTNNWFEGSRLAFDNVKNYDELIKKPFTKSDKATHLEFTKGYPIVSKKGNIAIRVTGNSDYPESMNQFPTHPRIAPVSGATEHLSWIAHQYKKPVQPVIYRRPQPSGPVSLNTTVKMDPIAAPVLPQLSPRTFTPNYANKTRAVDFWNPSMKGGVQGGWHRRLFNSMEEADNFMKFIRENDLSQGYDVTNSGVNTDADRTEYGYGGGYPLMQYGGQKKSYNPRLAAKDVKFQNWYKKNTLEGQRGIPYSDELDYDYFSFYKNGDYRDSSFNIENHFPDTYKRPGHYTFSNESIYSTPENPGGYWIGENYFPKGKFKYEDGGPGPLYTTDKRDPRSRASTEDSLAVYNQAKRVLDYYRSRKYKEYEPTHIRKDPNIAKEVFNNLDDRYNDFINQNFEIRVPSKTNTSSWTPASKVVFRKNIDKNKFYQRENANAILDTRAPMPLYDRRIQPTGSYHFTNNNPNDALLGDDVKLSYYDPVAVKPAHMLTPEDVALYQKRYGQKRTIVPRQPAPSTVTRVDPAQRPTVDYPRSKISVGVPVLPQLSPKEFTQSTVGKSRAVDFWNPSMPGGAQGGWHRRLFGSMEEADNFMKFVRENNLSSGYEVTNSGVNTDADRVEYGYGGNYPKYQVDGNVKKSWLESAWDTMTSWFSDEPAAPAKRPFPAEFKIKDPRKISMTTGKPIDPRRELVTGNYDGTEMEKIIIAAKRYGINPLDLLAIDMQERGVGRSGNTPGHVLYNHNDKSLVPTKLPTDEEAYDDFHDLFARVYLTKLKEADRLGIKDPATRIQVYNGLGKIVPETEQDFHGFKMKKIYGVPIPKGGIDMRKNPLYGKRIIDLRDNVLAKDTALLNYINQYKSGGQHGGLDRWFAEKWVDVKTGEECGRQEGDDRNYPACRPSKRINDDTPKTASELSSAERQKFIRSKTSSERINYQHRRKEYGGELNDSDMANKPNNPSLWSKAKALAKEKYDVYPSAYANGWAAKWYKSNGGTWSKAAYGMQVPQMQQGGEPDGAMALGQIDAAIDKLMTLRKFIQPDSDLEPWVSSKLTLMDHYTDAVSDYMQYNPEAQGMMPEEQEQMMMEEGGGIPERYKNMGFSRVGQKKESTSEGKKWMVLAKKGDDYKVVHGGYDGMQDYTQHGSEQRRENFWNRMGGRDSAKAQDPFSPLYWHKRFGTWEEGGEIPQMKKGGSTWAGNTWFGYGGRYLPQFQTLGATDTLPTYKTVDNSEITSRFSDMVQQQPTNAAPPFRPGAQTAGATTPAATPVAPPQGPLADSAAYAKALEMVDSADTRKDSVFASNVDKGLRSGTMTPEEAFTQTPMTPGEVFWRTAPYLALGAIAGKTLYNRANKKQPAAEGVEQAGKLNPEILDDYIKIIKQRGYREPDDFKNLLKLTTMGEDGVMRNVTPQEANEILAGYSFNKNKTTSAPARKLNVLTQEMVKVDGWQNYGFQNAEQADDWINNLDIVAKRKLMGLKNAGKTQEFNQVIGELIAQNAPTPVTPSAQPTVTPSADGTPKDPKAVERGKKGQEAIRKISEEFPEFEEFYEKQRERQRLIDQKRIEIVEANKKLKKTPTNSVLKGQVTRANNKIKELESITELEKEKMKVIQKIRNESNAFNRGILEKQLAEIDQAYNAKLKIKTPPTPVGAVDDILYRSPLTTGAPAPVGPVPITNFDDFDINPRTDQRDILGEKKYNMQWDEAARRYRALEDPSHAKLMEIQFNRASNLINQRQPAPSMLEKFRASDIAENLRDAIRFAEESGDLRFLRKILSIKEQGGQLPMAQVGKNVVFATSSPITGYGYNGQTVVGNNEGEIPTFLKFLDPTGVTSWGDAYETWNNPEANAWNKFGAALSVIPMVGKAGKIMKAADYARKSSLLGKATRAGKVALNAFDNTLSYPARVMDKVSPLQKAYEAGTGQMISNWGPRAKSAARWAGLANQGNRGVYGYNMMADGVKDLLGYESSTPQKKAGGGINIDPSKKGTFKAQASRMGMSVQEAASKILSAPVGKYSPQMRKKANFAKNFAKEYGGPVAGEVMDVSPEELEMLRQQGYEFEIL